MQLFLSRTFLFLAIGFTMTSCAKKDAPPYEGFEGVVTYAGKLTRANQPLMQTIYFKAERIKKVVTSGSGFNTIFLANFEEDSVITITDNSTTHAKLPLEQATTDSIMKYTGSTETIGSYETKKYVGELGPGTKVTMYLTQGLQPNVRHAIERSLLVGSSQGGDNQQKIYSQLRKMDMVPVRIEMSDPMNGIIMQLELASIEAKPIDNSTVGAPQK